MQNNEESFSVLNENQILRCGPGSIIIARLETNFGPIFDLYKCDVET